ncbi:putative quinol monooxygenase [Acidipila sp. EB88]|uniref:putative quinol monooxygenase n=1 Tax=Acidipila sp. EB88 TaxID=2305226 RepID=UPI000F5E0668|nr:putative quinol monooxygenase [Acidipila sp. EB88]RRA49858.1 antibiotic biosynthesis monooxygenase [Acidipila sp. EB88]
MPDNKVILLVEATVKPEHRHLIVAVANESLPLTAAEPGVEVFYQTVRQEDPNRLVFFEVFRSEAAHDFHMQQEYTRKVFKALEGRLDAPPAVTRLTEL